jgi:GNAT superfamily N-acetyltransferase
MGREGLRFRDATEADAPAIAALHADSWRRHYRDAYADGFLDGEVGAERLAVWTQRMGRRDGTRTIVVEDGNGLVGFAHSILDDDAQWGALLDNLHVAAALQRRGVGTRLLHLIGRAVDEARPASPLYLWVLEQNVDAQRFYAARGGRCVERIPVAPPGGDPARLVGEPMKLRYVWSRAAQLAD